MIACSYPRRNHSNSSVTSTSIDYSDVTDTTTDYYDDDYGVIVFYTTNSDAPVFIPSPKQSLPRQHKNKSPPANVPSGGIPGPPNNRPELDRVWNRQSS